MKYLILFITVVTFAQGQKFIPLDAETLEFVGEVKFTLFANKKAIFVNFTSKDSVTCLPNEIAFDSISFLKYNYKEVGLKKENLMNAVLLTKIIYELDEVIIPNSKPKEIVIGEESRLVNRSRSLSTNQDFGVFFRENELRNLPLKRLNFYVEKVKYKTTYKIKFYSAHETESFMTRQYLELGEILFESPIFILEKGTKNKVEINLEEYDINIHGNNVFVSIELQSYYDENNIAIQPENKYKTKLKFQLSELTNYYSKMQDHATGELTEITNINATLNHDFAFRFFKKPPRSEIVAPAIVLFAIGTK